MNQVNQRFLVKILLIVFLSITLLPFKVMGQAEVPSFLHHTDWIESGDLKKWNKLLDEHIEADRILTQSNDAYLSVAAVEADDIDEGKKQKYIAKYEKQAVQSYVQALEKYKDVYSGLNNILSKYIEDWLKGQPLYEEMQENSDQALQLYGSVGKASTDKEREDFSRANELMLSSIEKGIALLSNEPAPVVESPEYAPVSSSSLSNDELVMDDALYEKYKAYTSNGSIPDPIVMSQFMQLEGDAASFEAFEKQWQQYKQNEILTADDLVDTQNEVVVTDSTISSTEEAVIADNTSEEEASSDKSNTEAAVSKAYTTDENVNQHGIAPSTYKASNLSIGNEFRVQIAASRVPLSISQVSAIYSGVLSVAEIEEAGYYKYQIRSFQLYSDAQKMTSNTKVNNAFVTAYLNSEKLPLADAVKDTRALEQEVKKYGRLKTLKSVEFSIQLAASRVRLTQEDIQKIDNGTGAITTVFEEGWYKYQILAGKDLQNAFSILESCGVKKAFLVAYKNGRKQRLYKALNEYKTYKP